jgi:predicted Zn-ribbon and HTH transcriptional regulator
MIKLVKCKRCGHDWATRQETPTICPKCKTPYWDKERRRK